MYPSMLTYAAVSTLKCCICLCPVLSNISLFPSQGCLLQQPQPQHQHLDHQLHRQKVTFSRLCTSRMLTSKQLYCWSLLYLAHLSFLIRRSMQDGWLQRSLQRRLQSCRQCSRMHLSYMSGYDQSCLFIRWYRGPVWVFYEEKVLSQRRSGHCC